MGKRETTKGGAAILSNFTMKTGRLNPPLFPLSNVRDEKSGEAQGIRAFRELKLIIMNDVDINPES
jgi:hypothetical protein